MKKHYILAGLLMLAAAPGFAQVKIGAAGAPDASATLEVTGGAANNKGLLLPRLTTAQRNAIANPAKGLLIFNTTTNEVQTNVGTPASPSWSTTPAAGWNLTGNSGTNPATNFIGTSDNQPLVIRANNAEAARVLANGRVGIGVAAPETKLHVVEPDEAAVRVSSGNQDKMSFQLGNSWHGISRSLAASGGMVNDVALYTSTGTGAGLKGTLYLAANPVANDTITLTQFALKDNGFIGIGTKDPATKLHLNDGALRIFNGSTTVGSHAIHVINDGGGNTQNDNIVISSFGSSTQPSIALKSARGTFAAPENSQAGDNIGNLYFTGRRSGGEANLSQISATYLGDGTTAASRIGFTTSEQLAMTIDSSTNVGIGISSPKTKLQVEGGLLLRNGKNISHGNGTFITWSTVRSGKGETEFINYRGTGSGGFRFYDVAPAGNGTGVGTAVDLPVNDGGNQIAFIAPATGAYSALSDSRVKTNVNTINGGLEKVMAIRPVSYDLHTGRTLKDGVVTFTKNDKTINTIGFIAQELEKVVPEAVIAPQDPSNEFYTVSYSIVIPVLTKAIQEQQAEIEQLKAALAVARADNAALKADVSKITALADRMQKLEASLGTNTAGNATVSK